MFSIIIALIVGLTGGVLIARHWQDVIAELKKIAAAVSRLAELTWTASKTVLTSFASGTAAVIHTLFYRDEKGKITRRVTCIDIPESELPDWAREQLLAKNGEVLTLEI